ncbi:MAG: TPM domain-containing protein, partial [candidate division NC10 bacterium]
IAAGWKLGQAGKDNGVLLLIAKGDKRLRIEVGYGLEGVLPDGKTGAIIREVISPRFSRGEFAAGIEAGVEAIMTETRGAVIPEAGRRPAKTAGARASNLPLLIAAAALALAFAYPLLRRLPDTLFWGGSSLGAAALVGFLLFHPGAWWTSLLGLVGVALGTLWSVGLAERHHCPAGPHWLDIRRRPAKGAELVSYACPVCGYRRVDRVALAAAGAAGWFIGPGWTSGGGWGSGGGTGGFSGGGGGFGGGGASGSW